MTDTVTALQTAAIVAMKEHARQGKTKTEAQDLWVTCAEAMLDLMEEAEEELEKEYAK